MKNTKLLYTLFVAVLLLNGCGGGDDPFSVVIDIDPPEHVEQLAVHCYIDSKNQVLLAGLTETRGLLDVTEELEPVEGGLISLYHEGTKLFDFEPRQTQGSAINYQYDNMGEFGIQEGELELRASAPGFPELRATQSFPTFVPLTDYKFEEDGTIDFEGFRLDAVELTFSDPPGEDNYYEIGLLSIDSTCTGEVYVNTLYLETQDFNAEMSGDYNGIILSDAGFDGQEYKIILGFYGFNNNNNNRSLSLQWKCISRDHFEYSRSLRLFYDSQDFGPVGEPVSIYSNVENGIGVFTCSTDSLYTIVPSTGGDGLFSMTATVDGSEFEACNFVVESDLPNGLLEMAGINIDKTMYLNLTNLEAGVTGPVNEDDYQITYFPNSFEPGFDKISGDFEITDYDEVNRFISGTFTGVLGSFNTSVTIEVENLVFTYSY